MLTPDSIVPDPTNPQLLNRYTYVLNSPVNFTDPTGHCGSDTKDGGMDLELFEQCILIQYRLMKDYEINITGYWKLEEMKFFEDSLEGLIARFDELGVNDSMGTFKEIWGGVTFKRKRSFGDNATTTSKNRINLFNGTFLDTNDIDGEIIYTSRTLDQVLDTVSHELAHVWDRREGYALADGLKDAVEGSGEFCLGWWCTGNYTVGDNTPCIYVNNPKPTPKNSREDLASTFSALIVDPQALIELNPGDDRRNQYILDVIEQLNN